MYVVCPIPTIEMGIRYNSSVLLERNGTIAGVYHKNFPTHKELDMGIKPGTETPVFETDFGRVGLCICFDLNFWEVGSGLCRNKAELVIWSSMWTGRRMMSRWAIEFGFAMGGVHSRAASFIDLSGREIARIGRGISDAAGAAPLLTLSLNLDQRVLHHDGNIARLKKLYEKYGPTAARTEWIPEECLMVFDSMIPNISSDQLIEEFGLEPMRDYIARVHKDRLESLERRPRAGKE
jgi:hypothetical protein